MSAHLSTNFKKKYIICKPEGKNQNKFLYGLFYTLPKWIS